MVSLWPVDVLLTEFFFLYLTHTNTHTHMDTNTKRYISADFESICKDFDAWFVYQVMYNLIYKFNFNNGNFLSSSSSFVLFFCRRENEMSELTPGLTISIIIHHQFYVIFVFLAVLNFNFDAGKKNERY